jgi:hypothetical protein
MVFGSFLRIGSCSLLWFGFSLDPDLFFGFSFGWVDFPFYRP